MQLGMLVIRGLNHEVSHCGNLNILSQRVINYRVRNAEIERSERCIEGHRNGNDQEKDLILSSILDLTIHKCN
jgi:hypothetical protein